MTVFNAAHCQPGFRIASFSLVAGLALWLGCKGGREGTFNETVLCDRSSSGAALACGREVLREAAASWFTQVRHYASGRFEVALIGSDIGDVPVVLSREYPQRFEAPVSQTREQWRQGLLAAVDSVAGLLDSTRGSAIVEAVFHIGHRFQSGPGITNQLVLATDLRQVTLGRWNFERSVPASSEFEAWVHDAGLDPRFGVLNEIVVCGFHMATPTGTSRMTAKAYGELEALWSRLLARWAPRYEIREDCATLLARSASSDQGHSR